MKEDSDVERLKSNVWKFLYDPHMQAKVVVISMRTWDHKGCDGGVGPQMQDGSVVVFSSGQTRKKSCLTEMTDMVEKEGKSLMAKGGYVFPVLLTWSCHEGVNTPILKTILIFKDHGFAPWVTSFPRWFRLGLKKNKLSGVGKRLNDGVVGLIDFGNEIGCVSDDMISCGLEDVSFVVRGVIDSYLMKVVWEVIETRLAVEAARRFTMSLSLSMLSANLAKDSSMVAGVDVGGI
uniref:Cation-chloride cotransporter 1 isoform X5 n=1 Tax=Tanacetum cinerariifolium TaxID=118510 RepID=A0A6L2LNW3_TANCI|nr:cation-chloride cotransporter 1 isoform X5 [Tanacetum cinerariifolium]